MRPVVNLYMLGRMPYLKALNIQKVLFNQLKDDNNNLKGLAVSSERVKPDSCEHLRGGNSLLLVEHEPVYTIGLRTRDYDTNYVKKLKSELELNGRHAELVETNRGGLITFHGPGQLVAYPIIHLGQFHQSIKSKSLRAYVNLLEETIIDTLTRVGLAGAHRVREYPGVWLAGGDRKIAFIGISCKRFVTMHGISINCDCDLTWFEYIVGCGIPGKKITSIKREMIMQSDKAMSSCINTSKVKKYTVNEPLETQTIHIDPISRVDRGMRNDMKVESFDVQHVSRVFCSSFSQHFDCNLVSIGDDSSRLAL